MSASVQIRRLAAILLAAIAAVGAVCDAHADATIYRDCFQIIDGSLKHVGCTVEGLTGIDFAVDKCESNDWMVVKHSYDGSEAWIALAPTNTSILTDNLFTNQTDSTVTGTAQPFVVAFANYYKAQHKTWYGYVSLGLDENAQLVILDSAMTDWQSVLTMPGNVPSTDEGEAETEGGDGELDVADISFADVNGLLNDVEDATKEAMLRTVNLSGHQSKQNMTFLAQDGEPSTAPYACAHLGISPVAVSSEQHSLNAYYKMPTVEAMGIDPTTRTLIGRIVPAEGSRIVAEPLKQAFGFVCILQEADGTMSVSYDRGEEILVFDEKYKFDATTYTSNGVFKITFPETLLEEYAEQPAHLFRFTLLDHKTHYW